MIKKQSKILRKLTMVALAFALILSTVSPAYAKAAKNPTLNAKEVSIVVGKKFNFNIKNKVKGATYEWTTSNKKVVTINKGNGVVTGVGEGKTNITCTVRAGSKVYRLTAAVKVLKPAVKVTITNPVDTLNVKEYYKLRTKLVPASSTDLVTWSSSDESIVKMDKDGSFVPSKPGTVEITATTLSGRKNTITIKILGDGATEEVEQPTENKGDEKETEGETEEKTEDIKVLKKVYSEDFAKSTGLFTGRGSAAVAQVTAGKAAEGGKGYLSVTGRTANWNGAVVDFTEFVIPGASYEVTAWVRYTSGEAIEIIKATQEAVDLEGTNWFGITGDAEVKKGEWTKISGIMEVAPGTTKCSMYFEAENLIDFYVDNIVVNQLDTEIKEEVVEEVEKAKAGDIVYKNDFEGERLLDARVSSERSISSKVANSGKSSLQVTRTKGWDGAGVKFVSANDIKIRGLYDSTVHVSTYVMYTEGADEAIFKLNNKMEKVEESDNILAQVTVKKGEWTLIEADCFIANGTAGNMMFIETENDAALTFFVDDVEIKVVK